MKTVIVFREGQSGHYLKSIILNDDPAGVGFRMLEQHKSSDITLTHDSNYDEHALQFDLVLRILPTKKIYSAIYNNFMKKLITEEYSLSTLDHWHANSAYWYDRSYYNIVDYHKLITEDIQTNVFRDVINFDQILDRNYLNDILVKYFQLEFDPAREKIRKTYESFQLTIDLDRDSASMQDIVGVVDDNLLMKNPWFFSYCVHKYELANELDPKNRLWSVTDMRQIPTKQLLLTIAQQYN